MRLCGSALAACLLVVASAACSAGEAGRTGEPQDATPSATPVPTATPVAPTPAPSLAEATERKDLAYELAVPGNLLDLYIPGSPADAELPLIIWHTGSGWSVSNAKSFGGETAIVEEFTARGFAVASINIRSSSDARFPAQGFDVRAAIRFLRENAATYGIDPDRFAFMSRWMRRHHSGGEYCTSPGVVCEHEPPPPEYRRSRHLPGALETGKPVTVASWDMPLAAMVPNPGGANIAHAATALEPTTASRRARSLRAGLGELDGVGVSRHCRPL